ncbi:MAG: hypothetical protein ACREDR_32925 [Blastocatellia bacterium]
MKNKEKPIHALFGILVLTSLVVGPVAGERSSRLQSAQTPGAGCDLEFAGKDRKAVKLRTPDQSYKKQNDGKPLTVADFLSLVCSLDSKVSTPVPEDQPMDIEKVEVTLDAFIIAMKQDADNDFHIQIADKPDANANQIIVEVPPGQDYCDARQNVHKLFLDDGGDSLAKHVFAAPPKVEITGYLFLDSAHGKTAFCKNNGGRGIQINGKPSHVVGLWEIHPVITLKSI